jgi:predicted MFS family arabinose efflux permease
VTSLWSATATLSLGVSAAITGALVDHIGVTAVFTALGLLMAVPGAVWLLVAGRARFGANVASAEPDRLSG